MSKAVPVKHTAKQDGHSDSQAAAAGSLTSDGGSGAAPGGTLTFQVVYWLFALCDRSSYCGDAWASCCPLGPIVSAKCRLIPTTPTE